MRARLERGPNYVNFGSAPRVIRTPDLLIRSQTLYPTELWAREEERLVLAGVSAVNSNGAAARRRKYLPSSYRTPGPADAHDRRYRPVGVALTGGRGAAI